MLEQVAIDARGRIVMAGYRETEPASPFIVRWTSRGTLDETFAGGTGVINSLGGAQSTAVGVVVRDDGFELLARTWVGEASTTFVRRFDDAGEVDTSYGTGGDTEVPPTSAFTARGEGVVAGLGMVIAALDASGAPDPSFEPGVLPAFIYRLRGDASGRVVFGAATAGASCQIARLGADGDADGGFGTDGVLSVAAEDGAINCYVQGLSLLSDGGGFAVGTAEMGAEPSRPYLIRFTPGGRLETEFTGGVLSPETAGSAFDVVVDSAGRPVVLTWLTSETATSCDFAAFS